MHRYFLYLLFCSYFFLICEIYAQNNSGLPQLVPTYIKDLNRSNTSPAREFAEILQDKEGRIWLAPIQGHNLLYDLHLSIYDGYNISSADLKPYSLLTGKATTLCEHTQDGKIIGFTHNTAFYDAVFLIHPQLLEVKFFSFQHLINEIEDLRIRNVVEAKDGGLIVLVSGEESLHLFKIEHDNIKLLVKIEVGHFLYHRTSWNFPRLPLLETREGIWFMEDKLPLYFYSYGSKKLSKIDSSKFSSISPLADYNVKRVKGRDYGESKLVPYKNGKLLFLPAYSPSVFFQDSSSKVWQALEEFPNDWLTYAMYKDQKDNLFFLFQTPGFHYKYQAILQNPLGERFDVSAFVGHEKNEIFKVYGKDLFQHFFVSGRNNFISMGVQQLRSFQVIPFPSQEIITILPENQFVLYNTPGRDLFIFNENIGVRKVSEEILPAYSCLLQAIAQGPQRMRGSIRDSSDKIWFNSGKNIVAYNLIEQDCEYYYTGVEVARIAEIDEATLAFMSNDRVPYLFDKHSKKAFRVHLDEYPNLSIQAFYATSDSLIWMASSGGLWKVNPKSNQSKILGLGDGFQDFRFQSIGEDKYGRLWLGTITKGIHIYNSSTLELEKTITESKGLANNMVSSITRDQEGYMWAGTKHGLSLISAEGEVLTSISQDDGLPEGPFHRYAATISPDDRMLLGKGKSLLWVNMSQLKKELLINQDPGNVFLTAMSYYDEKEGKEVKKEHSFLLNEEIHLSPANRYLKLKIALSAYTSPEKNHFAYMLEGIDKDWTYIDTQHELNLSLLPAGKYRLLIKGANYRNIWTKNALAISINAHEFFYKQVWFYLLVFGIISLISLFWIRRLRFEKIRLAKEVQRRTRQIQKDKELIEQQAQELQQLDELKTRFFTNISHELRTPITLITAPAEKLLHQQGMKLNKMGRLSLQMILRNGRNLLELVEELLELSRLEVNKAQLHEAPTQLIPFCLRLFNTFESRAATKNIHYTFNTNLSSENLYLIDRKRLEKIVNNLLSNALKFTHEGGKVSVQCVVGSSQSAVGSIRPTAGTIQTANYLRFTVSDTGRGIPKEDLSHIFDRYFQTKSIPNEGGTGIGLALSKELAKLMKGDLEVKSEWGKGSSFILTIPLREVVEKEIANQPLREEILHDDRHIAEIAFPITNGHLTHNKSTNSPIPSPTILIVEDNPDMQWMIQDLLEGEYNCIKANHGREALDILEQRQNNSAPSLILSDVMMPEMDGYAFLERLKAHSEWQQLPIIMLTARAEEADKLHALRMGVDDYLTKPFSPNELKARIQNLLHNYRQRQAYREEIHKETSDKPPQRIEIKFEEIPAADQVWLKKLESVSKDALEKQLGLSAAYLSDAMALSHRQLFRRIKALTGLSVKQYIQEVKLQKARHLLENKSHETVAEVAYICGFNSRGYFSTIYRKRYGKKPASYLD